MRVTRLKQGCVLVALMGALTAMVGPEAYGATTDRSTIAPRYQHLKEISRDRGRVRVIARVPVTSEIPGRQARIAAALGGLRAEMARSKIMHVRAFRRLPMMVFSVTKVELDTLIDSGLVDAVHEDRIRYPQLAVSIPYIGGDIAHNFGYQGSGVTVAVLDTGIDASHSHFGGRVVEEACFSTRYIPHGSTSLCPSGTSNGEYGPGSAAPCDICDHGTHAAAITASSDASRTGVAPQANIIAIQVFSRFSTETVCGTGITDCIASYDSDLIEGLDYVATLATSYTVGAVNMSLGGGQHSAVCDTQLHKPSVDTLRALGIAVVAASGNEYYTDAMGVPACISGVFSVGSVSDADGSIRGYSNSASFLDILAPGHGIRAAVPGGGVANKSGTSMAAPHVAGAFVLLKQANAALTLTQREDILKTYSVSVLDTRNGLTFPRLDLGQVTAYLAGPGELPTVSITSPANGVSISIDDLPVTLSATASDPQDGNLTAQVQWSSSLDGAITSPTTLSIGVHVMTATVSDSIGFIAEDTVTVTVFDPDVDDDGMDDAWETLYGVDDPAADPDGDGLTNLQEFNFGSNPIDAAPVVSITAPADGYITLASFNVSLAASATDTEDGDLSGSVQWTSDLDGALGTGSPVLAVLSAGSHVVTATVTDSAGAEPVTPPSISVTVDAASAGDIDGDGTIDVTDLYLLQRTLTGQLSLSAIQAVRADVYPVGGDGMLDISDLVRLEQLLVAP